ncbi:MAG: hypothetical protein ACT6Q5_08550 [Sphingopyxis solisilvae]|uniref:hypothetical protein n=1 Tax=Sphingopyxis solisilvae TaxID=1886788 RepID=UPI00403541EE
MVLMSGSSGGWDSPMPSPAVFGVSSFAEAVRTYPASPDGERRAVLQRLEQVCASSKNVDQRRCDTAWRIIGKAHARLQAKRAAEAEAAAR